MSLYTSCNYRKNVFFQVWDVYLYSEWKHCSWHFYSSSHPSTLFHCLCHVSPLYLKQPKQVLFFNPIKYIFDIFLHTLYFTVFINSTFFFVLTFNIYIFLHRCCWYNIFGRWKRYWSIETKKIGRGSNEFARCFQIQFWHLAGNRRRHASSLFATISSCFWNKT